MKLPCLILALAALSRIMLAQADPWKSWDPQVLEQLHTARDVPYMEEEEKKVVQLMNMARHDGSLFAASFLSYYMEKEQVESSAYTRSLKRELKNTRKTGPLQASEDLFRVASGHALKSGQSGRTGHQGFNQRFKPLMGNPYIHVGENCAYGYTSAIDIVVTLLIDEGIENLGHRKNILNPAFNSVGVAIRPHKNYGTNCVIDFGRK